MAVLKQAKCLLQLDCKVFGHPQSCALTSSVLCASNASNSFTAIPRNCGFATKVQLEAVDDAKPFSEMPGPKSYPIIGSLWETKGTGGIYSIYNMLTTELPA